MATFIDGDATAALVAIHGRPCEELVSFARSTMDKLESVLPKGHQMVQAARQRMHDFRYGETARRADALRQTLGGAFGTDSIKVLASLEDLQQAGDIMRPYIMTTPEVAKRYHAGELAGYDELYEDKYGPSRIGVYNPIYNQSVDGLMVHEPEKERYAIYDFHRFGDKELVDRLGAHDRFSIANTRRLLLQQLEESMFDPTSLWNDLND